MLDCAMASDALLLKLDGLPVQPGVYMFKDCTGAILYVGKAKVVFDCAFAPISRSRRATRERSFRFSFAPSWTSKRS